MLLKGDFKKIASFTVLESGKQKIIFINQVTGYLFIDVINAFADDYNCELYAGQIDIAKTPLNPSVKKKYLIRYNRNVPIKRITTWGLFSIQLFFRLLFTSKYYQLFIVSNPPFAPFVGYLLHKIRGIKYHLLIYDVYPDALVNFGIIKKGSAFNRIWSKWNFELFAKANSIFTLSEGMSTLIKNYNPDVKVQVIHNWSDTSFIKPLNKTDNSFALKYNQVQKITVMYSGNMGATHAVEKIAELATIYKNDSSFGFLLVGDGSKKALLEKMKSEQQLDNLIILPYQSSDVLPYSLTSADIGIVTLSSGAEALSVPSKTYNLLAAGVVIMVIASANSELTKLINKHNCGVQFEENQTAEMQAFLDEMKTNPVKLREMKSNSRKASYLYTSANAKEYVALLNSNVNVS